MANALAGVVGELPEHAEIVGGSVVNAPSDVSFLLQIPNAATAIPAGTGNGWIDGAPFPSIDGATNLFARATIVTTTTSIRVESMVAAVGGESICFLSWNDGARSWTLYTAKILTVTEILAPVPPAMGLYDVTLDNPLTSLASNDWIFPASVRGQAYVDAALASYANLGPGEKADVAMSPGLFPRAYRKPRAFEQYPYQLSGQFLKGLEDSGAEVLSASWGYRNGGNISPTIPADIRDASNIWTPRRIAFYQDPTE